MNAAGHNKPPGPIELAHEAIDRLSAFLLDVPVIKTSEQAERAGILVESIRKHLADVEAERDTKVRPLNEHVATINAEYKALHNVDKKKPGTFDKLLLELLARLTAFAAAEEAKRRAAAEAARLLAEQAAQLARDAETHEREAVENAQLGECADVGQATIAADQAFNEFQKADRLAARADREVPVRIGSAFDGRALSMRKHETLVIDSVNKSITALGLTEKIKEAILSSARDYRKLHDKLPDGIHAEYERTF